MSGYPETLLSVQELANWLGLSKITVYREYRKMGIPFVTIGGSVRFRPESVAQWIADQENRAGDAA